VIPSIGRVGQPTRIALLDLLRRLDDLGALAALDTVGTAEIDDDAVTNAKLADVTGPVIKGRNNTTLGAVEDLTVSEVRAMLSVGNGNGAGDVTANAADTYLTGSNIAIGGHLKAGTILRWRLAATKTAAGTAAPVIRVRFGNSADLTDSARLTFTLVAQTAAADTAWFEIVAVVRTVSASGTVAGVAKVAHANTTTGFANQAQEQVQTATSGTFNNAGLNLNAGISVDPGASGVWTFQVVAAEAVNLA
jgi:hypothetical protein